MSRSPPPKAFAFTLWTRAGVELPVNPTLGVKTAVIVWLPGVSIWAAWMALVDTVTAAVPVAPAPATTLIGLVFSAKLLSKKLTVPDGGVAPVVAVTVAVNVTD